jgi:hypothetical protein
MNQKARRRAMRIFLAALLQSEMTADELNELSDELARGNLSQELAEFIREAARTLFEGRSSGNDFEQALPNVLEAFQLISRRKLSKKFVLDIMMLASPWLRHQKVQTDGTMRDLLERYFALAPLTDVRKFVRTLQGETSDQYLKGISRRE